MKKSAFLVLLFFLGATILTVLCAIEHYILNFPVSIMDYKFIIVFGGSFSVGLGLWYIKRREYAMALQESKERHSKLVELTSDWIWQVDENNVYTYASSKVEELLGYTVQEVIGKTPFYFMPHDEARKVQNEFEEIKKQRKPFKRLVNRTIRKDGSEVIFETSGIPVFNSKGIFQGYHGIDCDITVQKEAQDKLMKDYHLQSVINSMLQLALEPIELKELTEKTLDLILGLPWLALKSMGSIHIVERGRLVMAVQKNLPESLIQSCKEVPLGECICGSAASQGELIFTEKNDERYSHVPCGVAHQGHYCIPIISGMHVLGVMNLYLNDTGTRHGREELFLSTAANILAGIIERKKTDEALLHSEKALHDSEELHRIVLNSISEAVFITDNRGKFIYVCSNTNFIFGYSFDEIMDIGNISQLLGSDIYDEQELKRKKEVKNIEQSVKDKEGKVHYLLITVKEVSIKGGTVLYSCRDITERKLAQDKIKEYNEELKRMVDEQTRELSRAVNYLENENKERQQVEKALRDSEAKVRHIFDNAPVMMFSTDEKGIILDVNQTWCNETGHTKDETVGRPMNFMITEEPARETFSKLTPRLKYICSNGDKPFKIITKAGKVLDVLVNCVTSTEPSGRRVGLFVVRDITRLKKAELEVKRNYDIQGVINALLNLSLKDIPLEVILNRAIELVLSIEWLSFRSAGSIHLADNTKKVFIMKAQKGLSAQIIKECSELPFGKCLCGKDVLKQEIAFASSIDKNHEFCCKEMNTHGHYCVPILFAGKTLGVLNMHLKDKHVRSLQEEEFLTAVANTLAGIIQRKEAEEEKEKIQAQLRQAQKIETIGTLAGGIAHDFNNILGCITGYIEIAMYDIAKDSPERDSLNQALKACDRAASLVDQILTFSRQQEKERKPLQLNLVVQEAMKLLRATLPTTIEIRQNIAADLTTILADPTQMHQVIMNLCANASHAMRDRGGVLDVQLSQKVITEKDSEQNPSLEPVNYILLSISDTGYGISPAVMDRIFDPYFTTKPKGEGTGLGLAVVHGIVKGHGGYINVESEVGKGTRFNIWLPLIEMKGEEQAQFTNCLPYGKERILFVDDEASLVDIGKRMLERLGYQVVTKTSSIEAFEAFRAQPYRFDLVITDQTMPNMTGLDLAKSLLLIRPDILIILCTGFSETVTQVKAKPVGIKAFINKPIVRDKLAEIVRQVLDKDSTAQG